MPVQHVRVKRGQLRSKVTGGSLKEPNNKLQTTNIKKEKMTLKKY